MRAKNIVYMVAGILIGVVIAVPTANAAEEWYKAYKSRQMFYVDGEKVELDAYLVNQSNYIKLRDVAKIVGFEVWWDAKTHTVQIERDKPYTGEPPAEDVVDDAIDLDANMEIRLEVARLINKLRRENGLNELAVNDALMNAAQERAEICCKSNSLLHDKTLSTSILLKYNYGNGGAACNIGWSSNTGWTAEEIVSDFANSKGHYETMLVDFAEDVGVGVYYADGVYVIMYLSNPEVY